MFGLFGSPREATPKAGETGKVKDPICKMEIDPKDSKYSLEHKGKKYYFCSENCQKKFDIDSDKYVAVQKETTGGCCH